MTPSALLRAAMDKRCFGKEETGLKTRWNVMASDGAGAVKATGTYAPEPSGIQAQEGADSGLLEDVRGNTSNASGSAPPFAAPNLIESGDRATNAQGQSNVSTKETACTESHVEGSRRATCDFRRRRRAYARSARRATPTGKNIISQTTAQPALGNGSGSGASWYAPAPSLIDDIAYRLQDKHVDFKRVREAITAAASAGDCRGLLRGYEKSKGRRWLENSAGSNYRQSQVQGPSGPRSRQYIRRLDESI